MPERAGILFDAFYLPSRMPNQMRSKLVQSFEVAFGKKPTIGEYREKGFCTMSLALDIMVTIDGVERLRSDPHDSVVEDVQNIDAGQISTGMPCSAGFNNGKKRTTEGNGFKLEVR